MAMSLERVLQRILEGPDSNWKPDMNSVHLTLKYLIEHKKPCQLIDKVLNMCEDAECLTCGIIICPHREPLHFHHDGCPACADGS